MAHPVGIGHPEVGADRGRRPQGSHSPGPLLVQHAGADGALPHLRRTQEDLNKAYAEDNNGASFPVPKVKGGARKEVVVKPTPAQLELLSDIVEGFNGLLSISDPDERNIERLKLMDRARKVSLDARAVDKTSTSPEKGASSTRSPKRLPHLEEVGEGRRHPYMRACWTMRRFIPIRWTSGAGHGPGSWHSFGSFIPATRQVGFAAAVASCSIRTPFPSCRDRTP
jgi:hypothetical protein